MVRLSEGLRPFFGPLKRGYTAGTRAVSPATVRLSKLRGGWLPTGVAMTMEDAALDGGRFTLARPEEVLRRDRPIGDPTPYWCFEEALTETAERIGVLELTRGRVLHPHAVVVTERNRWLWEQCRYFGTTRPREHPMFLHPFPPDPVDVPGRLGVLTSRGDANYYHFLHDVLPRLSVLEQAGVERPDRWYVPYSKGWQRDLLAVWGIGPDDVVNSSEVPHVRAETLVVPSLASIDERNPPWVSEVIRERMVPAGLQRVPGKHLYLTRGAARNNRSVLNETEVMALLAPLGFELVDTGVLSIDEQISAFAEADVIVAPHGASLANLPFCSPGSALVELFPSQCMFPDFWKVACGVAGLDYRYLSGAGPAVPATRAAFVVADITVDLPKLEAMVSDLLAARQ
ncbi:glycosyltransferase family 61 protein [Nocardioides marmoriginsengisoli]|uniref:Glycosyltransferase family 61 protein n=1 Tax=Nocardioides marmoriginsengisoli TaxID=661483 RepID=A0A3N0CLI1_9ACTN|nr:glycosyltransferase family 61 protein [Nocardioides marmoriginsengisoli]RNL63773.1 glycosyltransferase family 61 protein [Nocardioides marmoriginsengisoli]